MDDWDTSRFIGEEIEVIFEAEPTLAKSPHAPSAFIWRGDTYPVQDVISEWFDFSRRGGKSKNMRPARLRSATKMGSWGAGRFYFRVRDLGGRVFDLYYDRAPEDAADRNGHWYLWREIEDYPEYR